MKNCVDNESSIAYFLKLGLTRNICRSSRAARLNILKSLIAVSNVAVNSLSQSLTKIIEHCYVFKRIKSSQSNHLVNSKHRTAKRNSIASLPVIFNNQR